MMVKSLSRKNYKMAVRDLVSYIDQSGVGLPITHNLAAIESGENLIQELQHNVNQLPSRRGGNVIYHEILSYSSLQPDIPQEAMIDLANEYLRLRAPLQQAFARIHMDTDCPHVHLAITAGDLTGKRVSYSKAKFQNFKLELERIQKQRYPALSTSLCQGRRPRLKKSKGEQAGERRNKNQVGKVWIPTLREQASSAIKKACATSSRKEFIASLQKSGYRLYERGGKITGIENTTTGKHHRLKSLGTDELFRLALHRWQALEQERRLQRELGSSRSSKPF